VTKRLPVVPDENAHDPVIKYIPARFTVIVLLMLSATMSPSPDDVGLLKLDKSYDVLASVSVAMPPLIDAYAWYGNCDVVPNIAYDGVIAVITAPATVMVPSWT